MNNRMLRRSIADIQGWGITKIIADKTKHCWSKWSDHKIMWYGSAIIRKCMLLYETHVSLNWKHYLLFLFVLQCLLPVVVTFKFKTVSCNLPERIVMNISAPIAPANTMIREWRMDMMAVMKKVLSPSSETMMTENEATHAWMKPRSTSFLSWTSFP